MLNLKFWKKGKSVQQDAPPTTHIVAAPTTGQLQVVNGIRRGDWVSHLGAIGILHQIGFDGCEVHLTDSEGITTSIQSGVNPSELRLAYLEELPWNRLVKGLTLEEAQAHSIALVHSWSPAQ